METSHSVRETNDILRGTKSTMEIVSDVKRCNDFFEGGKGERPLLRYFVPQEKYVDRPGGHVNFRLTETTPLLDEAVSLPKGTLLPSDDFFRGNTSPKKDLITKRSHVRLVSFIIFHV